jgi:hypothetical protein
MFIGERGNAPAGGYDELGKTGQPEATAATEPESECGQLGYGLLVD